MGTRHEDQPAEHWAGPESLDPTPVWKQYLLVGALLAVGLVVIVAVAVAALAPQFVTPPAVVPGDRLVLSANTIPAAGAPPVLISTPIVSEAESFWLSQPKKGDVIAMRAEWRPHASEPACRIFAVGPSGAAGPTGTYIAGDCKTFAPRNPRFDGQGQPMDGQGRALDRYLVSVSGDRVIVNLSRVIEASERTSGPVPTGIPQPQQP
jgi:hypothetical protein